MIRERNFIIFLAKFFRKMCYTCGYVRPPVENVSLNAVTDKDVKPSAKIKLVYVGHCVGIDKIYNIKLKT